MSESTTRAEHLTWCKERAKECLNYRPERGDAACIAEAMASVLSDMNKHEETRKGLDVIRDLGTMELAAGTIRTKDDMKRWIDGIG